MPATPPLPPTVARPLHHLRQAAQQYPGLWPQLDRLRAARGTALPAWPDRSAGRGASMKRIGVLSLVLVVGTGCVTWPFTSPKPDAGAQVQHSAKPPVTPEQLNAANARTMLKELREEIKQDEKQLASEETEK